MVGHVASSFALDVPHIQLHMHFTTNLSHRSLTVHPAPLSSTAPAPNSAIMPKSGIWPGGHARVMDHMQGQARSHVPVGCGRGWGAMGRGEEGASGGAGKG